MEIQPVCVLCNEAHTSSKTVSYSVMYNSAHACMGGLVAACLLPLMCIDPFVHSAVSVIGSGRVCVL